MEKKNKRRNKIIIGVGIGTLTFIGGIILYRKCPKVKGVVDLGVSKVIGMCKGTKESTELSDFKTKPRTYKTYNGKNI